MMPCEHSLSGIVTLLPDLGYLPFPCCRCCQLLTSLQRSIGTVTAANDAPRADKHYAASQQIEQYFWLQASGVTMRM